jgi:hypothetical protein
MLSSWRMYEMHPALFFKTGCYKNSELQMKKMLEEERIMTMELDTMHEHLQQFYRNLQNEIIARRVYK